MHVVLLHNAVSADAGPDEQDVLVQVDAVRSALQRLGHRATTVPCTLDLSALKSRVVETGPDVVFNLVEALAGADRLGALPPLLLEALGIACTGSSAAAFLVTTDKPLAKRWLSRAGLPTPAWVTLQDASGGAAFPSRYIVKTCAEHASLGLEADSIVTAGDAGSLRDAIAARSRDSGRACFAEEFVPGREFNLSLLAGADASAPEVLPPAEIDLTALPADAPRIVGYRAKWDPQSAEYQATPRRFDLPATDVPLLDEMRRLSRACWGLFGLRGYARIDFRLDAAGRPWILEVNVNPCLSPDAGFAAALEQAGIPYDEAVQRILTAATSSPRK
jgi:D-alanine-D-alanine ligase